MIFFAFSDENGGYKKDRDVKYIKKNPYFLRAAFLMRASDWKKLNNSFREIKTHFNLPLEKEIKWSYIWSLKKHQEKNLPVSKKQDFYFLKDTDWSELFEFVKSSLKVIQLPDVKIITTITSNMHCGKIIESKIFKWHIQNIIQRIEMELQDQKDNLCTLFIDYSGPKLTKVLREAYFELYQKGDFINYTNIKDSLNIEYSHHSVGIQLTDFIVGCFGGFLRGFEGSKEIFDDCIRPYIRSRGNGELGGYGIIEIPTNENVRKHILEKLEFDGFATKVTFAPNV
jgi:hypothetical protein